jgi:hypothetical protein
VIISREIFDDTSVAELLDSGEFEALSFEMTLKGFEEEQVQLWRVRKLNV